MQNNHEIISVRQYERRFKIELIKILVVTSSTYHASSERMARMDAAMRLDEGSHVDNIFVVDKGHRDGLELHVVTSRGIIYVLNKEKFEKNINCLVTVLIGRPNQVARLYRACGLYAPNMIIQHCIRNKAKGRNEDETLLATAK